MDYTSESGSSSIDKAAHDAVTTLLCSRNAKARFLTEMYASLERSGIDRAAADRALGQLESAGIVMVRDHFCADPHLAGVDLRVVTIVETERAEDPQLSAIRRIDEAWNKWLSEYLTNHRCG